MIEIKKDDDYYMLACVLSDHLKYELSYLGAKPVMQAPVKDVSAQSVGYETRTKTKVYAYSQIDHDFYLRMAAPGQGFILASMIIGGVNFLLDAIEASDEHDPRAEKTRLVMHDLVHVEPILTERAFYIVTTFETKTGQA